MFTLIDAGPMVAYYNAGDDWHQRVRIYFEKFTGQFITTCPVVTEVMFLLAADYRVQNELLLDVSRGLYYVEPLMTGDYSRIAELNEKYRDLPGDFADLSLVAVSERLNVAAIASLDADFNIYRRYRKGLFQQALP